ncbi:NERD domain-containing protein [Aquibacillus salsiterrae]|uniref:NERD domain-containing protein n=1 Tax=Aquibacillus salsiterrae TaxID=2950439 RepID=A0A9X4ADQ6_9BACI|nr:NERD domain-containing protein [Aquibacillus salsiterrae]MDC3415807.1 NERD domain-containing protein [Aquibacillus salsiterrae]
MAQLIKLEDYISRYEKDIYHYPAKFIRLKKDKWKKVEQEWEVQSENSNNKTDKEKEIDDQVKKWKFFLKRKEVVSKLTSEGERNLPLTKKELKIQYLNNLLPFQLNWASTTVNEMSFLDRHYFDDLKLKYLLQRFPDTYLLLYYPVFQLKNQPMDGEIILVSPIEIEIIKFVEIESTITIITSDDRTWSVKKNNSHKTLLSPLVSLNRTEQVIQSILKKYKIEFPIRKVVLSRTNEIEYNLEPYHTRIIGRKEHEQWLNDKRKLIAPIKHQQLKVCDLLLKHCFTNAFQRPEWDEEGD